MISFTSFVVLFHSFVCAHVCGLSDHFPVLFVVPLAYSFIVSSLTPHLTPQTFFDSTSVAASLSSYLFAIELSLCMHINQDHVQSHCAVYSDYHNDIAFTVIIIVPLCPNWTILVFFVLLSQCSMTIECVLTLRNVPFINSSIPFCCPFSLQFHC